MKSKLFKIALLVMLAAMLASCAPAATPTPETITVVETKIVAGTPVVEQVVVTATPQPMAEEPVFKVSFNYAKYNHRHGLQPVDVSGHVGCSKGNGRYQ